jgi:hypothetical protein
MGRDTAHHNQTKRHRPTMWKPEPKPDTRSESVQPWDCAKCGETVYITPNAHVYVCYLYQALEK